MISHQDLVAKIANELYHDSGVEVLILYGSVCRHEESANSDIDLLAIITDKCLQKRHEIHDEITIEYVEMHVDFMLDFLKNMELPMLFALTKGIVLFDKTLITKPLISQAMDIIKRGPPKNAKWGNEDYVIKRRSDLTEIYKDLLDVDDEATFHYLVSLLLTTAIPWMIELHELWPQTRKKTMDYLKNHCAEGYSIMMTLLTPECSLPQKRIAAKELVEYTFEKFGGILKGNVTIFRKDML